MVGAGILAERAKPRLAMPASYITLLVQVLVGQSLSQLPISGPGKAAQDGSRAWAPGTHRGDPAGAPGSWLQLAQPWLLLLIEVCLSNKNK